MLGAFPMEYIFEDDVGELGSEVEAYCQKCRTEGPHTVITRYEDEVRQVQCGTCGHVHVFKPTRPEPADEDVADPGTGGSKRRTIKKLSWEEAIRHPASSKAKAYGFRDGYRQGDYLDHPKFGKGYVNEVLDDTKIEAVFKDGTRVLVHNRKDLAAAEVPRARAAGRKGAPARQPTRSAQRGKPAKPAKPKATDRRHAARKPARPAKPQRRAGKPRAHAKPKAKATRPARRPARSRGSRR